MDGGGPRVGWLGGSFDPVHDGHLHIARAAADALALDTVLLVPAATPPHKRDRTLAPAEDRLALLAIACGADPRFVPSDVEISRGGVSFSIDTAQALLAARPPGTRLYAIIGADTLADLPTWRRIGELLRLVTFCPLSRPGQALDATVLRPFGGEESVEAVRAHTLVVEPHPASSTAIRAALLGGGTPRWLPPGVLEAIRRRGLYGAGGR